ncbi:carbon monoxide dehydrogenase [Nonomuraea sp. PA05]|uniref:CoxG family protein n=1 Tax=Nonomuraea sp. PA05 TaxID=2604466 RepID=UPI0011D69AC4|nr:SRPBCC domain-containing protein [Nonomuraea sp. PA05]TYB55357.1 carbon monoxide dehydrogenase [Nonomuraea sp. PA05]
MISITEEIAVPSARARVWEVISDPAQVVSCIGGAELGAAHEDGSFDGTLVVKFGAVRVKFAARVTLELAPDEFEGRLSARGRDGQRATRFTADATFRVVEAPDGARVAVSGEIGINGKLAGLVESGAGAVVTRMTKEFSERLIQHCATPATADAADAADEVVAPAVAGRAAPVTTGLFGRLRAWWARLRQRRDPAPMTIHQSKEAGTGNAQAQ